MRLYTLAVAAKMTLQHIDNAVVRLTYMQHVHVHEMYTYECSRPASMATTGRIQCTGQNIDRNIDRNVDTYTKLSALHDCAYNVDLQLCYLCRSALKQC